MLDLAVRSAVLTRWWRSKLDERDVADSSESAWAIHETGRVAQNSVGCSGR
jgi:hypothetical protein